MAGRPWCGARLLHALWSMSVLVTQLAQTSHSVYFPISALCICKYAPKGAALGELVTKQPEITATFAHKVGVKNLSLYVEIISFKKLSVYLTRLIRRHVCISTCWINNINLRGDVRGLPLMARRWKQKHQPNVARRGARLHSGSAPPPSGFQLMQFIVFLCVVPDLFRNSQHKVFYIMMFGVRGSQWEFGNYYSELI